MPGVTGLRVLIVEDSADDAALLLRELRRGFERVTSERVETREELAHALRSGEWDLVVTDFSLPTFSGPETLEVVAELGRDVPVIVTSGTVDEESAIRMLKAGAADFLTKGRFARLVPAVHRELREAQQRRERAQALEALRESEDRHRQLFEANPLPTFVLDQETRALLDANAAAVATYGYSREEFLKMRLEDLWPPEEVAERLAELLGTDSTYFTSRSSRPHIRRDGRRIDVEIASHPLIRGGRTVRVVVVNDVTERRSLEAQLRQAQKVEAISQLASGIAHDFNNILSVILSYAQLAGDQLEAGTPVREDVDEIARAAERAGLLTQQLLAFSRRQPLQPVVMELNACIGNLDKMLRRTIGANIDLTTRLAPDAGLVIADRGQIEQVVLNLVLNARDAMPKGGTLSIATFRDCKTDLVGIRVSDSGTGMDESTKARVFEPFFTTKEVGQGTGLGLATVFSIVQQSGGHIEVDSKVGVGTTFTVCLPRYAEAVAS
ncbi:MAG: response receiver sensor histidine kinase response regulator [Labilithrix sp.]|nr:response receiver sensor histidine kinase response regulator [Labilithrix sp.]